MATNKKAEPAEEPVEKNEEDMTPPEDAQRAPREDPNNDLMEDVDQTPEVQL